MKNWWCKQVPSKTIQNLLHTQLEKKGTFQHEHYVWNEKWMQYPASGRSYNIAVLKCCCNMLQRSYSPDASSFQSAWKHWVPQTPNTQSFPPSVAIITRPECTYEREVSPDCTDKRSNCCSHRKSHTVAQLSQNYDMLGRAQFLMVVMIIFHFEDILFSTENT